MTPTLRRIRKALVAGAMAGFFAGLTGLASAMSDGNLTGPELVIAGGLTLGALGATGAATWAVRNATMVSEPPPE